MFVKKCITGLVVLLAMIKEKKITVKPKQPGTYELICRYHLQEGMVGKVIVE